MNKSAVENITRREKRFNTLVSVVPNNKNITIPSTGVLQQFQCGMGFNGQWTVIDTDYHCANLPLEIPEESSSCACAHLLFDLQSVRIFSCLEALSLVSGKHKQAATTENSSLNGCLLLVCETSGTKRMRPSLSWLLSMPRMPRKRLEKRERALGMKVFLLFNLTLNPFQILLRRSISRTTRWIKSFPKCNFENRFICRVKSEDLLPILSVYHENF